MYQEQGNDSKQELYWELVKWVAKISKLPDAKIINLYMQFYRL